MLTTTSAQFFSISIGLRKLKQASAMRFNLTRAFRVFIRTLDLSTIGLVERWRHRRATVGRCASNRMTPKYMRILAWLSSYRGNSRRGGRSTNGAGKPDARLPTPIVFQPHLGTDSH